MIELAFQITQRFLPQAVRLRKNYINGLRMNCKTLIFNIDILIKMSYCADSR